MSCDRARLAPVFALLAFLAATAATGAYTAQAAPPAAAAPAAVPQPAASSPPAEALPAAPVNLDFEQGELGLMPVGWTMTAASERAGFGADLTDEQPYQGQSCAVVRGIGFSRTPGAATLMQSFDAAAYRGQRVRFRAAVRTENSRAQLWLAVERPHRLPGFFDDMADRPIDASRWQVYEIVGEVAADATRIGLGLTVHGDGRAWIDAGAFDVLGPAGAGKAPPRPLTERALTSLVAFARLLGYVRYFHPSDQAAAADWGAFAAAAAAELDPSGPPPPAQRDGAGLAAALQRLFAPLAPTLRVYPTGGRPPALGLGPPAGVAAQGLEVVAWRHIGLGSPIRPSIFSSMRVRGAPRQETGADLDPRAPFAADLGGGASCLLPLALWADDAGTLPHPVSSPASSGTVAPVPLSPEDRNSRLAIVMLAWNVLQHFDPGLSAGGAAWQSALPVALREAAAGSDGDSLLSTLRRMVAVTGDGQATVISAADPRIYSLPIRWDWIEGQVVVTEIGAGAEGLHPGDAVVRIGGREASAALRTAEAEVAASTPQWRRWRALFNLALGGRGETLRLEVEAAGGLAAASGGSDGAGGGGDGTRRTGAGAASAVAPREVTVAHGEAHVQLATAAPRAEAVREAVPGVLVVDLSRLTDGDLEAALSRLAQASGIVFDLRGAVRSTDLLLAHLVTAPVETRRELVPVWSLPDRAAARYAGSAATIVPEAPRLAGRLAFLGSGRDVGVAEGFLATVAELRLGAIVGGPTGGASGTVDSAPLPAGFMLTWTGTRPAEGAPPAGTPVQPTVPAAPTRRGIASGRDEVLEMALSLVTPAPAPGAR
jgi:hypothetical protein